MDVVQSVTLHATVNIVNTITSHACSEKKQLENNKTKAGKAGAIETIVSAMKAHVENANACNSGFNTLLNITQNNGKMLQSFQKTTLISTQNN